MRPSLIFRKAPWYLLDKPPLHDDSLVYHLSPAHIMEDHLASSLANIVTGVHVSLAILDQSTALLLNPVTYSPALLEQFGQRILPVYLTGVKLENDDAKKRSLKAKLQALQDALFDAFVKRPRHISGTLETHYLPELRKGMILRIDESAYKSKGSLSLYDKVFYVYGVSRNYDMAHGEVRQSLQVKWGRRRG